MPNDNADLIGARARQRTDGNPDCATLEKIMNDAEDMITRASCRWCAFRDITTSICRNKSPRPMMIKGELTTVWPKVSSDDWCAQWARS